MYAETDKELAFTWEKIDKDQLDKVAREIIAKSENCRILTLSGDLGAGKTTLVKAMCKVLDVIDMVSSPTFSIINEYRTIAGQTVYHFDCYRLNSASQLNEIGVDEYLYSGNYCFIEWPEIMKPILNQNHVELILSVHGTERNIEMRII